MLSSAKWKLCHIIALSNIEGLHVFQMPMLFAYYSFPYVSFLSNMVQISTSLLMNIFCLKHQPQEEPQVYPLSLLQSPYNLVNFSKNYSSVSFYHKYNMDIHKPAPVDLKLKTSVPWPSPLHWPQKKTQAHSLSPYPLLCFFTLISYVTTNLQGRSRNLHHFYLGRGSNWGYLSFLEIKITVIRQVRMFCSLSVKVNMQEMPNGTRRLWTHFVCVCFCVCGWQKSKYPQFEPHG